MGERVSFVVPGPPRGKGRPRFGRAGRFGRFVRAYTDPKTRAYEDEVRFWASRAMGSRTVLGGPVRAEVLATMPMPKSWSKANRANALSGALRPVVKPDADNLAKVLDALNGVVWRDDAQVVELVVRKVYGAEPSLIVEVVEFP